MNVATLLILIIIGYYALKGYTQGLITILIELAGYVIAYIVSLRYAYLGVQIIQHFMPIALPQVYLETLGIAVIFTLTMFVYYLLAPFLTHFIPPIITHSLVNKIGGVLGSALKGIVLISIILFLFHLLPLPQEITDQVQQSPLASGLQQATINLEKQFGNNAVLSSLNDTINQITLIKNTVGQKNDTSIFYLAFKQANTSVVPQDEQTMFQFVNQQRIANHIKPLTWNTSLQQVARAYAGYMFANGYLSHISPEGQSPLDRVQNAKIAFLVVGENIANAPDVTSADIGLMKSPEHKANILDPSFNQIGIGAIDGGPQLGKIYVQDFIGTK